MLLFVAVGCITRPRDTMVNFDEEAPGRAFTTCTSSGSLVSTVSSPFLERKGVGEVQYKWEIKHGERASEERNFLHG
jgi:hypothetical protein